MKKKLAALLRRWAYALHPETPATLPPGYKVAKVVSQVRHLVQEGKMPPEEVKTLPGLPNRRSLRANKGLRLYTPPRRHTPRSGWIGRLRSKPLRRLHTEENEITITPNKNKQLC